MIDGTNTTVEWQKHTGNILILPVGALEQHDAHLPLNTDIIHAEYYSRIIADELDAALLPVQAVATSLEHSGFRGSFSLGPETLMQIIRDIVDEAERQNFKILIVVNGHGGNHCLVPVCRDINRLDRKLKILLINPYEFWNGISDVSGMIASDVHAGKNETSIMLLEKPETVRKVKGSPEFNNDGIPLRQSDLTTFGAGHFNPDGAIGHYELASKAEGKRLTENTNRNLIAYIRDRIERLQNQPRFVGNGGLAIRNMIKKDIPVLLELIEMADWNQTATDWKTFLNFSEKGCFVMVHMGMPVASITTIGYENKVSWIGMLLVNNSFRKMGIASELMKHAMEFLQNCDFIKLAATPEGKKVYDKLGFKDECMLTRMINNSVRIASANLDNTSPVTAEDLPEIMEKDKYVFGADRTDVLKYYLSTFPDLCFKFSKDNKITGYSFGRRGKKFTQIGPLVADDCITATELLREILPILNGKTAVIDVIDTNLSFNDCLNNLGFTKQRPFIRMYKGEPRCFTRDEQYFAIAGPELG
ncbi:MAG: GNAT family N-acetyltransferase [Victivallaceae bacterium]|jgi:creatinine amidohydrolase/Fe(II)-dependent formamide hydrolase-like protein